MAFALFRLVLPRNKRGNRVAGRWKTNNSGSLPAPYQSGGKRRYIGFRSRAAGKTNFPGLRPSSAALIVIYYRLHRAHTHTHTHVYTHISHCALCYLLIDLCNGKQIGTRHRHSAPVATVIFARTSRSRENGGKVEGREEAPILDFAYVQAGFIMGSAHECAMRRSRRLAPDLYLS